jgi:hypothetical protein
LIVSKAASIVEMRMTYWPTSLSLDLPSQTQDFIYLHTAGPRWDRIHARWSQFSGTLGKSSHNLHVLGPADRSK